MPLILLSLFATAAFLQPDAESAPTLDAAQRLFYNARYDQASAAALSLRAFETPGSDAELANLELRTSSLHFQIKNAMSKVGERDKALKQCEPCADLIAAFLLDLGRGQKVARARLAVDPADETALFFLGKINLNYVWLQLGTLGRKTGWDQYWEARKSLDAVLKRNPEHIRARVARAWIDYIVDTRMPRGTRWLLGGGNRKRALAAIQSAAKADAEFFVHTEAAFALWDMQVRERNFTEATELARILTRDFPENPELASFLKTSTP
jgi:tetratricopeptide (TPR) repeat protein